MLGLTSVVSTEKSCPDRYRGVLVFPSSHNWTISQIFNVFLFKLMQWEFQVGPSVGISAGDEVWVARYILEVLSAFNWWHLSTIWSVLFQFSCYFVELECKLLIDLVVKQRIAEIAGVVVSFDPKPIPVSFLLCILQVLLFDYRNMDTIWSLPTGLVMFLWTDIVWNKVCINDVNFLYCQGDWNGAGAHTNYR